MLAWRRYDLLTLFQSGRSHMVVLTAPPRPEALPPPRLGTPNKSMELAQSLNEMKASSTPPRRTEEGSVLVVGSSGTNGHQNGPIHEVGLPHQPCPDFHGATDAACKTEPPSHIIQSLLMHT